MTTINVYLTFNGNCEEAFDFYKIVFGGEFSYVGRYKDMPPQEGMPALTVEQKEKILHIGLPISKETVLMGSDNCETFGPVTVIGNNFSVSIETDSNEEAERLFNSLAEGGEATMPLNKTFWGAYFGMLTDKFGVQWMVQVNMQNSC